MDSFSSACALVLSHNFWWNHVDDDSDSVASRWQGQTHKERESERERERETSEQKRWRPISKCLQSTYSNENKIDRRQCAEWIYLRLMTHTHSCTMRKTANPPIACINGKRQFSFAAFRFGFCTSVCLGILHMHESKNQSFHYYLNANCFHFGVCCFLRSLSSWWQRVSQFWESFVFRLKSKKEDFRNKLFLEKTMLFWPRSNVNIEKRSHKLTSMWILQVFALKLSAQIYFCRVKMLMKAEIKLFSWLGTSSQKETNQFVSCWFKCNSLPKNRQFGTVQLKRIICCGLFLTVLCKFPPPRWIRIWIRCKMFIQLISWKFSHNDTSTAFTL